ncbi:MAG TPA: chemotaxis protein CheB [Acidobacteriota bacterium]|nr:chemotaxis protein CheB [Acidobacteriota bacterium]
MKKKTPPAKVANESSKGVALKKRAPTRKTVSHPFPIVGIGASAGGLEAFEQFFKHMPPDSAMAFILVPHLDPGHASMMPDLLRRYTQMKVVEVANGTKIAPNQVYIVPPNRDMAVCEGTLQLTQPEKTRGLRMPIDSFLRSLAEDQGENAICIILSGSGTDGSMGLRAVHGAGGMSMVQSTDTARYEGMPRSALDTGLADFVLPVEKMPEQLLAYVKKISSKKARQISVVEKAPTALQKVLLSLRTQTGHDFSHYKKTTIYRRIEKRMDVHNIEDITHYVRYLHDRPDEVQTLLKELLIGVTSFFRDPEAFEVLKTKLLPMLVDGKPEDYQLRIWVPACATGEEAYSIAMVVREFLEREKRNPKFQIFGTDIDEEAIRKARTGIYPDNVAIDVSPDQLKRFFVKDEFGLRIKKDIRENVVFALQNVIKDAPFTKLDLLSCRNLLIYLEPELQDRLLPLFSYSLRPGGILFLGSSESIGRFSDLFITLDKKWKFFQTPASPTGQTGAFTAMPWYVEHGPREVADETERRKKPTVAEISQHSLLDVFVPPLVVVNEKGDIAYVHGQTGKYLEPAPGAASMNVLEMARTGLRFELRSGLHMAVNKKKEAKYPRLNVKTNGEIQPVNLTVKPLVGAEIDGLYLVTFEDAAAPVKPKEIEITHKPHSKYQDRIRQLEQDLAYTKETLQATIEELQATNEELRSTNEEHQSTNEELQSTNEELETSKEELQSVNEELVTVNSELQAKLDQLSRTEGDMKALLESINIGTIFLDPELQIKRFTGQAAHIFHLISTDVGRPISDIRSKLEYDSLAKDSERVLETLQPSELELHTKDNHWYLMRIQPSRTPENVIDGVAVTFTDIDKMKRAEQGILSSKKELFETLESIKDGFFALDKEWRFTYVNQEAETFLGKNRTEILGRSIWQCFDNSVSSRVYQEFQRAVKEKSTASFEVRSRADESCLDVRAYPAKVGLCVYFRRTECREPKPEHYFF